MATQLQPRETATRARGTGRVFKPRGCRFWYLQWYDVQARSTRSGRLTKRRTESSRSSSRSVAEQMLRERLGRKDRGEMILNPRKVTFKDLERLILNDYNLQKNRSLRRLKTALNHLRKFFGGYRAVDITGARWMDYVVRRQQDAKGNSESTIMAEHAALNRMFSLAIEEGLLSAKPKFKRLRVENVRPVENILSDNEIADILADEKYPEDLKAAFEFGALTGWRIPSEVWTLTWRQVDRDEEVLRWEVGRTKNRKGRTLHYGKYPALKALIERWWAKRRPPSQYVFHRTGKPIASNRRRAYREWDALCERLEIRGKHAYTVRHNMVIKLDRAGVPPSVARTITGHETESMRLRYRRVRPEEQEQAIATLARIAQ